MAVGYVNVLGNRVRWLPSLTSRLCSILKHLNYSIHSYLSIIFCPSSPFKTIQKMFWLSYQILSGNDLTSTNGSSLIRCKVLLAAGVRLSILTSRWCFPCVFSLSHLIFFVTHVLLIHLPVAILYNLYIISVLLTVKAYFLANSYFACWD